MSDSGDESGMALDAIFVEPPRPPSPEPTIAVYSRDKFHNAKSINNTQDDWSNIEIRLVGSHPLWGHHLWNASRSFASYLDIHCELYRGLSVLELGAGGALPGIVAARNGAQTVVLTDYPDTSLIDNITFNVQKNIPTGDLPRVHVQGYIWGHPVEPLLRVVESKEFDLIIMSDLIFNHSQHDALLNTCDLTLSKRCSSAASNENNARSSHSIGPCLLVFYTHHRPHLAHRDMEFFVKAKERGWFCEEILTEKFPPMFPEDPGEEEVRATVHGWRLTRIQEKK
ncbi:Protein N-methyltransferase NNT1 [Grifola frondosa]|uniref:Protein N-terminal and lysine N-methyltransferase EFM7 n=1 Tax=Grifola frondosa TaxID=5627 RepID=A0A1C7ML83_GRIFR|nr:Protein N-methyltransferase NNT1 [Grifola frondosa]